MKQNSTVTQDTVHQINTTQHFWLRNEDGTYCMYISSMLKQINVSATNFKKQSQKPKQQLQEATHGQVMVN